MFYVLLNACLDIIPQRAFYDDFRCDAEIYFRVFSSLSAVLIFNPLCDVRGGAKCMMYGG